MSVQTTEVEQIQPALTNQQSVVVTQAIEKLRAKKESDEAAAIKRAKKLAKIQKELSNIFSSREIYYVQDCSRFWEYFEDTGVWMNFSVISMKERHIILSDNMAWIEFNRDLEMMGNKFSNQTFSFRPVQHYTLNRLRKDHWLKPSAPTHRDMVYFDLLMTALSGGNQENIDHIEQVIGWKYLHPEDSTLPCICIYGEGGVGKNLLVDFILKQIFGDHDATTIKFSNITSFNDALIGKTIVFIDEMSHDKADMEIMKGYVGNPTVAVSQKYVGHYTVDNTALYLTGSNGAEGAIKLAKDESDRRWSIIRATTPLVRVIADAQNVSIEDATLILKEHIIPKVFRNRDCVAAWLGRITEKASQLEYCPSALHGSDYKALLNTQQDYSEEICQEVFEDPNFKHITADDLYDLYKIGMAKANPRGGVLGNRKFWGRANDFIRKNDLKNSIQLLRIRVSESVDSTIKVRKCNVFTTTGSAGVKCNRIYYVRETFLYEGSSPKLSKENFLVYN